MQVLDHTTNPPTAHITPCVVRGIALPADPPVEFLPAGVYRDGGTDAIPTGKIATASRREVRNGMSVLVYDLVDAPPVIKHYSKLAIRRALRANGLEPALDAFLAGNATYAADWNDAQELASDDPVLQAALPVMAAAAGITTEQALAILAACEVNHAP